MEGAADGSYPDNRIVNSVIYRYIRHGLHHYLC